MADKYLLHVTAGPSYDPSTHQEVAVNGPNATQIKNSSCTANVKVRIQNYRGKYSLHIISYSPQICHHPQCAMASPI